MSVVIIDGRVAVAFCTSVATLTAPTVAEINAGTRLETFITPTGLNITPTTGAVDVSNLGSKANAERAGRVKYALKMTFHHDGGTDTAWNLFPYRTNGFVVVRRGIDRTVAFATTQQAEVYAVETGEPDQVDPAPSGVWDFNVDFFLTEVGYTARAVVS
jgi:hypothetical protein